MAGVTDLVYRRLNQLMLIGTAVRVVAVSADHQALAQRHVRRHVHLVLFLEVALETDLGLGPRVDEWVGAEFGSQLVIRGLVHDHVTVDAFDASESMHTGLPERLVALLMTGETRAILARLRFARVGSECDQRRVCRRAMHRLFRRRAFAQCRRHFWQVEAAGPVAGFASVLLGGIPRMLYKNVAHHRVAEGLRRGLMASLASLAAYVSRACSTRCGNLPFCRLSR